MKKIIFYSFLVFFNFKLEAPLWNFIQNCDRLKENCVFNCIQNCRCTACCDLHHVLTSCMDKCCCAEEIQKCIEACDQMRSDCLNSAIEDFCLDPWCDCPSCGMNF